MGQRHGRQTASMVKSCWEEILFERTGIETKRKGSDYIFTRVT
jgi:hypothetical protein